MHDLAGDAAEEDAAQRPVLSAGTDHQQVDPLRGHAEQDRRRVAPEEDRLGPQVTGKLRDRVL
jgi:hypothetical protein